MQPRRQVRLLSLLKPLLTLLLAANLVFLSTPPNGAAAAAQNTLDSGQIQLTNGPQGVSGTYTVGDKVFTFEGTRSAKQALRARIAKPDGNTLVECSREGDAVTVVLPTGKVVIDLVRQTPFSDEESKALATFSATEEAALVRGLLYNLSRHRTDKNQKLLAGFAVIAMLLGDGRVEGAPSTSQKGQSPTAVQKVSFIKCTFGPAARAQQGTPDCHGCCGPGCWGCTGCYTEACKKHDDCVKYFWDSHPYCQVLLAAAVASMLECVGNN